MTGQAREAGAERKLTYRVRHMTIEEHAHTVASNWVYNVWAWRGRSPGFMQAQVQRLADEIAAAETIAYEAGAEEIKAWRGEHKNASS